MARVLLALDGSEAATKAARRAVEVFGETHRYLGLSVLRPSLVASQPASLGSGLPGSLKVVEDPEPDLESMLAHSEHASADALDVVVAATRGLPVEVEGLAEVGDPGEVICQIAQDENVDVIVLGSHNKGRARRLLLGSTSEHVLEHPRCLVLVLGPGSV